MSKQDYKHIPANRRVFIQYLNPEILSLYGIPQSLKNNRLINTAVLLTKYALLLSEEILIMPATYLFEVKHIQAFLDEVEPLCAEGILQFASPTPDFQELAGIKMLEYRDEYTSLSAYKRKRIVKSQCSTWIPRLTRDSAKDIGLNWQKELRLSNGIWRHIIEKRPKAERMPITKLESIIENVPNSLDGRAFIFRFVKPLVPISLDPAESTVIAMSISKSYLESYLGEYNAMILIDTPLGQLDCGLQLMDFKQELRKVSFRELSSVFTYLKLKDYIESELEWEELIEIRENPIFDWLMKAMLLNLVDSNRPLDKAFLRSKFQPREIPRYTSRKKILKKIEEYFIRIYATLEPLLGYNSESYLIPQRGGSVNTKDVFLIHGRDNDAVDSMKTFLRSLGLNPIEWEEAIRWTGTASPYTLQVIQTAFERTIAVVSLFTPDDEVKLRSEFVKPDDPHEEKTKGHQARPNVLIETGMAIALYQDRTIIVEIGKTRPLTDLGGINVIRFNGSAPSRNALKDRLRTAHCDIKEVGSDYLSAGFSYLLTE